MCLQEKARLLLEEGEKVQFTQLGKNKGKGKIQLKMNIKKELKCLFYKKKVHMKKKCLRFKEQVEKKGTSLSFML